MGFSSILYGSQASLISLCLFKALSSTGIAPGPLGNQSRRFPPSASRWGPLPLWEPWGESGALFLAQSLSSTPPGFGLEFIDSYLMEENQKCKYF
jgi:hypothetical protein